MSVDPRSLVCFLGPPGAGKSSVAKALARLGPMQHVSTGDLCRQLAKTDSPRGRLFRDCIERGVPFPDELAVDLVTDAAGSCRPEGGVILDGFPRTLVQAQVLDRHLGGTNIHLRRIIHFAVTHDEAVRRLSERLVCDGCGAAHAMRPGQLDCPACGSPLVRRNGDPDPGVLAQRRAVFFRDTGPVLEHYRAIGRLTEIDAEQSREDLLRAVRLRWLAGW